MFKIIKLFAFTSLLLVSLVIWRAYRSSNPMPSQQTRSPADPRKDSPKASVVPANPLKQIPPDSVSNHPPKNSVQAQKTSSELAVDLDVAKSTAISRIHAMPEYIRLDKEESTQLARLEQARKADLTSEILDASSAYNKARFAKSAFQEAQFNSDREVKRLEGEVAAAKQLEQQSREAAIQAEGKRIEEARIKLESDPTYQAIQHHHLVRGMTFDQAIESLGKPYSITDGGTVVSMTWERGGGDFWSGTFVNGVATVVDHTIVRR